MPSSIYGYDFDHELIDFLIPGDSLDNASVLTLYIDTGKSLSEELILASTNPQYDKRLFIELRVQYMKTTSSEHVVYTNWFLF